MKRIILIASSCLLVGVLSAADCSAVEAGPAVKLVPGGYSINDPALQRLYGPGAYVMDALGNLYAGDIKGFTYQVSQRFRAPVGGTVDSITTYWPDGPGYAGGTGGRIRVRIFSDDGSPAHHPDLKSIPLSEGRYEPRMKDGRHASSKFNDPVAMASAAPLVLGHLYHVVYDNLDSDAATNFASVNCVATVLENGRPARWLSPLDWAVLASARPVGQGGVDWKDLTVDSNNGKSYYAPILQVALKDGSVFGNTNMETGNVADRQWQVVAGKPVRERFVPGRVHTIAGFAVNTAASVAGRLNWQLKQSDTVLASGSIGQEKPAYRLSGGLGRETGVFSWYDITFEQSVLLQPGAAYDLVFEAAGDSVWHFADQRNGRAYGYRWPAAFTESQAQGWYGLIWRDFNHWSRLLSSEGANWRVVLFDAP